MKISFCGKGGCGKSTVTTLLAKEFSRMGKRVLVIDCDESNFGLDSQLGIERPANFIDYFKGENQQLTEDSVNSLPYFADEWGFDDIPEKSVTRKDGISLMITGKIENSNEGCACALASLLCIFTKTLKEAPDEIVLMDMEAGVEHMGRGIDNAMDVIIMVVDPSYESFRLTKKIQTMANEIDKPLYFVLNKATAGTIEKMRSAIEDQDKIICELYAEDSIITAGMEGKELASQYAPIQQMAAALLKTVKR